MSTLLKVFCPLVLVALQLDWLARPTKQVFKISTKRRYRPTVETMNTVQLCYDNNFRDANDSLFLGHVKQPLESYG